eukprot:TRINITY_DN4568_c0_g1_i2.p1 TRINITY_DN4568_c0_g1~~TRINITY_DN4568_c0_g1_i2.p1  ORF type:complete len:296 (+),score=37.68 TRINITY_DN4568_c0_g1_i2:143-1030(+)
MRRTFVIILALLPCLGSVSPPQKFNANCLIYNRVPKTGSSTIMHWLRASKTHRCHISTSGSLRRLNVTEQQVVVEHIMKDICRDDGQKHSYTRHFPWMDFTQFGYPQPLYINTLRDPIERAASAYEYARVGEIRLRNELLKLLGPEQADWDFHRCVREGQRCNAYQKIVDGALTLSTRYFCGHDLRCYTDPEAALRIAKQHLDEEYIAVGLLEAHTHSLQLFKTLLPSYFSAIPGDRESDTFRTVKANVNANRTKSHVAADVRRRLEASQAVDIEFYNYASRRIRRLFNSEIQTG